MLQRQRIILVMLGVAIIFIGLIGRLYWLQGLPFLDHRTRLTIQSVKQRHQEIVLDPGRGHFYDRHMTPLTGAVNDVLIVSPEAASNQDKALHETIQAILGTDAKAWEAFVRQLKQPELWRQPDSRAPIALTAQQAAQLKDLQAPFLCIAPYQTRHSDGMRAANLIGFIGENPQFVESNFKQQLEQGTIFLHSRIGVYGLEKTFENKLRSVHSALTLSRPVSALGEPFIQQDASLWRLHKPDNPFYPVRVVTTIDLDIQTQTEALLDQYGISDGAIVVMDAKSADVLAMASAPKSVPGNIKTWTNKAVKVTAPGSIFKTVVSAAALDLNKARPHERFYCAGDYGKYRFRCWEASGHGRLSFREAYAKSCNVTFAHIMQRMAYPDVERTAERLGLLTAIGWEKQTRGGIFRQFDGEEAGKVYEAEGHKFDEGARLQTAIGQRDVAMSPLQAANLVVTLLNDGTVRRPRIVSELRYQDGSLKERYPSQIYHKRAISRRTARLLREWMKDTVKYGTGTSLNAILPGKWALWQLAGKSGTAQLVINGQAQENTWFIGYGPADHPRYAAAVLVRNKPGQGHQATKLFGELMRMLQQIEKETTQINNNMIR